MNGMIVMMLPENYIVIGIRHNTCVEKSMVIRGEYSINKCSTTGISGIN